MQERLDRLTKDIGDLNLEYVEGSCEEENFGEDSECMSVNDRLEDRHDDSPTISQSSLRNSSPEIIEDDSPNKQIVNGELHIFNDRINDDNDVPCDPENDRKTVIEESGTAKADGSDLYGDAFLTNKQSEDRRLPNAILPLLRYCQYESSESSCRYKNLSLFSAFSPYLCKLNIRNGVHCALTDVIDVFCFVVGSESANNRIFCMNCLMYLVLYRFK